MWAEIPKNVLKRKVDAIKIGIVDQSTHFLILLPFVISPAKKSKRIRRSSPQDRPVVPLKKWEHVSLLGEY